VRVMDIDPRLVRSLVQVSVTATRRGSFLKRVADKRRQASTQVFILRIYCYFPNQRLLFAGVCLPNPNMLEGGSEAQYTVCVTQNAPMLKSPLSVSACLPSREGFRFCRRSVASACKHPFSLSLARPHLLCPMCIVHEGFTKGNISVVTHR
jgi:hypothetical protein